MLVTANKFAAARANVRVRLLIDQKIRGLALSAGDEAELTADEARRLKNMGRVEIVPSEETPKKATR
jgi:hypothetical protein